MSAEWQPIKTAPKDGTPFIALNHDREVYPAKYVDDAPPRLAFRKNYLREVRSYIVHENDGKKMLEEETAKSSDIWENCWCFWTRGYDFKPTHWMPLPEPPRVTP